MKKLPKVFQNTNIIHKKKSDIYVNDELSIEDKIYNLFKSTKYVYKIDVKIKLKDGIIDEKVIGRKGNYLLTLSNKLIPIDSILDIVEK